MPDDDKDGAACRGLGLKPAIGGPPYSQIPSFQRGPTFMTADRAFDRVPGTALTAWSGAR
jgi:hypothetical protein